MEKLSEGSSSKAPIDPDTIEKKLMSSNGIVLGIRAASRAFSSRMSVSIIVCMLNNVYCMIMKFHYSNMHTNSHILLKSSAGDHNTLSNLDILCIIREMMLRPYIQGSQHWTPDP